jgi:glutamine synthetase
MTVLNAIVAQQLKMFKQEVDVLIKQGDYKDVAILKVLRRLLTESRRILFEGDNYSKEWHEEAAKRGLSNNRTTPEALDAFISEQSLSLFEELGIMSRRESLARYEIMLHNYTNHLQIESRILGEMIVNQIIPACITYQNQLLENIDGLKDLKLDAALYEPQMNILKKVAEGVSKLYSMERKMRELRIKGNEMEDAKELALMYCNQIKPIMEEIREVADELETIVDDNLWPLPKYREMLFSK